MTRSRASCQITTIGGHGEVDYRFVVSSEALQDLAVRKVEESDFSLRADAHTKGRLQIDGGAADSPAFLMKRE